MSDQGGSSQRPRKRGFSLFNRRRQPARSRVTTQPETRSTTSRGDLCQLTDPGTEKAPQRANGWAWLWGQRSQSPQRNRRRSKRTRDRLEGPTLIEPRTQSLSALERRATRIERSSQSSTRLPNPRERLDRDASRSLEDALRNRATSNSRLSSKTSQSASILPLGRRGAVDPRSSVRDRNRPLPTRLQSHQPTLIQASTSLQQNTVLQDQDTALLSRRGGRSRKRLEVVDRPRSRSLAIALYAARMLILSVGVGVLAGTVLSAWNPATSSFWNTVANQPVKQANSTGKAPQPTTAAAQLPLSQELASMKTAVQGVAQQYPGFTPGVFLIDLDTNNFMDWRGGDPFPAASTIKVPILIAFFQDVDAGKIRLDDKLTMRKDLIATEAGDMQYLPPGAQFSALETATKMITISDNTATNMLIDRLGGMPALNQRFKSWGLSATQVTNLLPDLKGTNTTSPKELASLMVRVSQGELVSLRSRDRILDIMSRTINNSQLPQGLGEGATISHKTGDISSVIGDVGLIDMPSGKRYATAVMIRRRPNDDQAYDLVQKVSRAMYQHFINTANPKRPTVPAAPTTPLKPSVESDDANPDG